MCMSKSNIQMIKKTLTLQKLFYHRKIHHKNIYIYSTIGKINSTNDLLYETSHALIGQQESLTENELTFLLF